MTHSLEHVERVLALHAEGLNACAIARATGVPRSTLRQWIAGRQPVTRPSSCFRCGPNVPIPEAHYVYLLGLYLGDGTISRGPKGVWRLRISQDLRYPVLIDLCAATIHAVLPNKVLVYPRIGCAEIGSSSKHWPCLFPQTGPGRKHERKIELVDWQQELVREHPKDLVRGLIHSDGCRFINPMTMVKRGRTYRYEYWRYSFTNASDDIRKIFTDTCEQLGVHWTQMNARNVAVSRQADVAFLDTFIGPKS